MDELVLCVGCGAVLTVSRLDAVGLNVARQCGNCGVIITVRFLPTIDDLIGYAPLRGESGFDEERNKREVEDFIKRYYRTP